MPFDSNGNYTLPTSYFVENGDTVLPIQHNPPFEDVAQALSASLLRDGRAPLSGNLNAASFKITNLGDATLPADAVRKSQLDAVAAIVGAGYISPGFNLANNVADATNDIDFPAGSVASEGANPILMTHAAATVQLDVAYGTGSGGRFDSAISDGWWHCFIISNGTTVSRGFSKSLNPTSQPNYPAGFANYRRVASWPRVSGSLVQLRQREDYFEYLAGITDRNSNAGFPSGPFTISAPFGIQTQPKIRVLQQMASAGNIQTVLTTPGKNDMSMIITTAANEVGTAYITGGLLTNTSSQITLAVTSPGGGSLSLGILITEGWTDTRGRA